MNGIKVSVILAAFVFSATVNAAPRTLPEGSLACASQEAFDKQFAYLSNGVAEMVSGCGTTNQDLRVVVIDYNILDATEVSIIGNGATLYVIGKDLE